MTGNGTERGRSLLDQSWDAHVHCFDPVKFPFKPSRDYTPQPASLEDLVHNSFTTHIMIVQASIEDGHANLVDSLRKARKNYPDRIFRGTIATDPDPASPHRLDLLSDAEFDNLHTDGVRSIRIHGSYGGSGSNLDWIRQEISLVAQLYPVRRYGWSISSQLPLKTWAALADDVRSLGVTVIADHNATATPSAIGSEELRTVLDLVRDNKLYIKIGALHRRATDNDIATMRTIVEHYARANSQALIWGSDWPHLDTTHKGTEPGPPLPNVNTSGEIAAIKSWLSEEEWKRMLVETPARLFG